MGVPSGVQPFHKGLVKLFAYLVALHWCGYTAYGTAMPSGCTALSCFWSQSLTVTTTLEWNGGVLIMFIKVRFYQFQCFIHVRMYMSDWSVQGAIVTRNCESNVPICTCS